MSVKYTLDMDKMEVRSSDGHSASLNGPRRPVVEPVYGATYEVVCEDERVEVANWTEFAKGWLGL